MPFLKFAGLDSARDNLDRNEKSVDKKCASFLQFTGLDFSRKYFRGKVYMLQKKTLQKINCYEK